MNFEFGKFETEMNRGFLQILVLLSLDKTQYGYKMLYGFRQLGYIVEENTLYPLLRRLENNGFILSEWKINENRPKKFYKITENGKILRKNLIDIWKNQNAIIDNLMEANDGL